MAEQQQLLTSRRARGLVQVLGTARKELLDVLRQPRLIVVLVAGPFLILVLFAVGFDQDETALRTQFVGPEGSVYEQAVATYEDILQQYLEPVGYSSDVLGAQQRVASGELDLVVQFPPQASEQVLEGEQAVINVFHEKIDPVQRTSVEIAARLAVLELNAEIVERVLTEVAGDRLTPVEEGVARVDEQVRAVRDATDAGDVPGARAEAAELESALADVERGTTSSTALVQQLGGDIGEQQRSDLDALTGTVADMQSTAGRLEQLDDGELTEALAATRQLEEDRDTLQQQSDGVLTLEPEVLARPFRPDAENLQRRPVQLGDFFAPSAIALLLAHLALTVAAMGLVRGEGMGLFEIYRVGPMGTRNVLAGTYLSHLVLGAVVAAASVAAVVWGVDVPLRGNPWWLVPGLLLLVAGSVGLGLVVGLLARSDTQAVQMAMLVLLAGLFFGGFFLDLELFHEVVRVVSWALPVTFGISLLQDVLLRGDPPALVDWLGLVGTTVVYGGAGAVLLRRRLRIRRPAAA